MNAADVAKFAMADFVAESDAEPRARFWPVTRRQLVVAIVVALAQFSAFAWAMGVAHREAGQSARAEERSARLEAEMLLLQTRCTVFVDGSASCPAGVFETGAAK